MINIHMYEVMGVALSIVIVLKVGDGLIAVMNNSKLLEVGDSVGVTTVKLLD